MTTVEQNIVNTYARLFEGLSSFARLELIERIILFLRRKIEYIKKIKKQKKTRISLISLVLFLMIKPQDLRTNC